jgi:hypothetical protein
VRTAKPTPEHPDRIGKLAIIHNDTMPAWRPLHYHSLERQLIELDAISYLEVGQ